MMTAFAMWSNGFLQTLEIYPARRHAGRLFGNAFCRFLRRCNPFSAPLVNRIVLNPSGDWLLEFESGQRHEARLCGGWIIGCGQFMGLYWKCLDGQSVCVWLTSWRQDPDTWRRFQVRLRMPV